MDSDDPPGRLIQIIGPSNAIHNAIDHIKIFGQFPFGLVVNAFCFGGCFRFFRGRLNSGQHLAEKQNC
ncbi:hypothetical protein [Synechocystis sp. LKSZ1]|uniref:hypothetical protein n=1 Tax=Synechocystis sp. LKSZ1 TaxID=3144951 RepID=UPI00336BB53E